MHKKLIKELFEHNFGNLLTEELSISKDVYINARNISQMLRSSIAKEKKLPYNKDGIIYKQGILSYPFDFDNLLNIEWNYYNFLSKSIFEKEYKKIPYNNSYNKKTHTIKITIFAIDSKIDIHTLEDTLMHEIEHLFQHIKSDNDLLKTTKDNIAYQNASVNKGNLQNNAIRAIGNIFYYSKDFEQDAQVNGAYAYMMKKYEEEQIVPSLSYKDTEAYAVLIKLKLDIDYCYNGINSLNKKAINSYVKQVYGDYTIEKIIALGEKALKRLSKKLMKVCAKAQIDIERKLNKEEEKQVIYRK